MGAACCVHRPTACSLRLLPPAFSPCAACLQLASKLSAHRPLSAYLERLSQAAFAAPAPSAADAGLDWSSWGASAAGDDKCAAATRCAVAACLPGCPCCCLPLLPAALPSKQLEPQAFTPSARPRSLPPPNESRYSKARNEKDAELQRKGRRWLLAAAAAVAAYVLASGQYLQLDLLGQYEDEGDEEDEEE